MHLPRRHFLRQSAGLFGAALLPLHFLNQRPGFPGGQNARPSWLARLLDQDSASMYLLRRNVGVFLERGGTIAWLVDAQGIAVVDSQFPEQAGHLIAKLKEKSEHRIDLLINTHHHGDHTGGNIAFKGLAEKVVGHINCRANQERVAKERNAEDSQLYADLTFEDRWSQRVGDEIITARYFGPAHTNGDAVIHFENANIAHMGDLLFNRRHPYIDMSAGASVANWIEVLGKIRKTYDKDTVFVFGHAFDPVKITGNKEDLKAFEKYLSNLLKFVRKEVKAGKMEEEITAATTFPGIGEWQGDGVGRSLRAAYQEVAGKSK